MLHTIDEIVAFAPLERVFELAADVERWPALLPHYRYVRPITAGRAPGARAYAMGATRSGIPVRWSAVQRREWEALRIAYHHVAGITRGMDVEWRFEPGVGGVRVTIEHRLVRGWPLVASPLGQVLVGELFVRNVARRTLRGIKREAERGR